MPKNDYRPNAAALIVRPDGKLLICERDGQKGAWQFPQGGVDDGESFRDAVIREIREEVGISPKAYTIIGERGGYQYDYPPDAKKAKRYRGQVQTYFLCQLESVKQKIDIDQKPKEFQSYDWIKPRDFKISWLPEFKRDVYRQVMLDFFQVDL